VAEIIDGKAAAAALLADLGRAAQRVRAERQITPGLAGFSPATIQPARCTCQQSGTGARSANGVVRLVASRDVV
jgi:hypothetical protein